MNNVRLTYWFAKTAKPFGNERMKCPSIHVVINSKAAQKTNCEIHNTLNLIRLRVKSGKSAEMALCDTMFSSTERKNILKRWLRNLENSRTR